MLRGGIFLLSQLYFVVLFDIIYYIQNVFSQRGKFL